MPPESSVERRLPYLRAWRLWRGYSQAELSVRSGVSKTTIVQLENGRTVAHFVTIAKLAGALGLNREQLLRHQPREA